MDLGHSLGKISQINRLLNEMFPKKVRQSVLAQPPIFETYANDVGLGTDGKE